jgi:hypothetical protein
VAEDAERVRFLIAPDPAERVGFLIAGVQKGGTTALFDHLRVHPDLSMAPEKEVHFFDDEGPGSPGRDGMGFGVDWSAPDYAAYHARFAPADGRLRGEATPIYLYWPPSLARIAAYDPSIKLILVFRDPVQRAWSHWRMERARGVEPLSFSEAIRSGRARVDDPAAPGHHRVHSYVERGFYAAQIARLLALFPRQQVFFGDARLLRTQPTLFLRNVCEFLNVPTLGRVAPLESHVGRSDGEFASLTPSDKDYLTDVFADDQKQFRSLTGIEL